MADWFEDEGFWRTAYAFIFPAERIAAADGEVSSVLKLVGAEGVRDVLDLCCGIGRHSIALAARGLHVTGVDRTEWLLDRARERAAEAKVDVEWVNEDMRSFRRPSGFDLALSLFTSFGYFDRAEDNQRVIENCFAALRPGGALVVDVMGKEVLARISQPTISQELPDGRLIVQRLHLSAGWTCAETEWIFIRGDRVESRYLVRHWVYGGSDLTAMLRSAGFSTVRLYGSLNGDEYGPAANRLIAIGRKA